MGLGNNRQRRLPFIYDLPNGGATEGQFLAAINALASSPDRGVWDVLDRDADLALWYGGYVDFHPQLRNFCSLDVEQVRRTQVGPLIDRVQGKPPPRRVQGLPERMTRTFLARYRAELQQLQAPGSVPNPARVAQLEDLIEQLEDYLPRSRP
jgi:hypothetical protein